MTCRNDTQGVNCRATEIMTPQSKRPFGYPKQRHGADAGCQCDLCVAARPQPSRPFGVLVDTRLPVSNLSLYRDLDANFRYLQSLAMESIRLAPKAPWFQWADWRAAFRNAESAEASE